MAFAADDIHKEHERLKNLGVRFVLEPAQAGPTTVAVIDDTCGNLIQLYAVITSERSERGDLTQKTSLK